ETRPRPSSLCRLRGRRDPASEARAVPEGMKLFDPKKLLLIAGPCSLETERVCRAVAESLTAIVGAQPDLKVVFKGSFDKANRTSVTSARGSGLDEGLRLLA